VAVHGDERLVWTAPPPRWFDGVQQVGIHDERCIEPRRVPQDPTRVLVTDGDRVESTEPVRPLAPETPLRPVVPEARGIRHELVRPQPLAVEDVGAAVPGVGQVPHLVAPDDDDVIYLEVVRSLQREPRGSGQRGDGAEELCGLPRIPERIHGRDPRRRQRPKRARPLGSIHSPRPVIQNDRVVTPGPERLHQ